MRFTHRCANDQDLDDKQEAETYPQKRRVINLELKERLYVVGEDAKTDGHGELHLIRGRWYWWE